MGAFAAMDVAQTGATFAQAWINTLAHNLANINTVRPAGEEPFRAQMLLAQERLDAELAPTGSGVQFGGLVDAGLENPRVHDPMNPNADADGYVTMPAVDLAAHMSDLIIAQRSFQASMKAIRSAEEIYRSSLSIGARG